MKILVIFVGLAQNRELCSLSLLSELPLYNVTFDIFVIPKWLVVLSFC